MLKFQSNQSFSISKAYTSKSLIKFCYFTCCLLLLSCGESKNEKPKSSEPINNQKESNTEESKEDTKTILCFGDSITAGYGLEDTKDAYPNLLQQKIDSLGLNYTVINSGLSGETTAGGKSRISWVLNQEVDIFLLELGANDGLRGVAISETRSNLQSIIDKVQTKSPSTQIILAGMQLPPNMGQDYTSDFKQVFSELASKNNIEFIPFILKDVGGIEELNQNDGIHPNVEGHQIVAENVWDVLKPMITK
ncbi:arylesterase [Psychroflexus tropicus]|uniref:arylesterase n=1 Tax=Psychroflexus tropicus TaxID=197345 RepID=UPI000476D4D9|nr:arylesterase [Psychroflexus tropicus]